MFWILGTALGACVAVILALKLFRVTGNAHELAELVRVAVKERDEALQDTLAAVIARGKAEQTLELMTLSAGARAQETLEHKEEARALRQKWESHTGLMEKVIQEREAIWALYQGAALGAGNAQQLLVGRLGEANGILRQHKDLLQLTVKHLEAVEPALAEQCRRASRAQLPELSPEMATFLEEYHSSALALPSSSPNEIPVPNPKGTPARIVSRETVGAPHGGGVPAG